MKVVPFQRVMAYPVQAAFPFPIQPTHQYTDALGRLGPLVLEAGGVETNAMADVVHLRPMLVPHNNFILGDPPMASETWYNTNLPTLNWQKNSVGGRLKQAGDVFLVPWVKSVSGSEVARALHYSYLISDPGVPDTRYSFTSAANTIDIETSGLAKWQGFRLMHGILMDARNENWSGSSGNWTQGFTFPANATARPYYDVEIQVGSGAAGSEAITYYTLRMPMTGFPSIYRSTVAGNLGTKIQEIRPSGGLGAIVTGLAQYGYFGYYGWGGGDGSAERWLDIRMIAGWLQICDSNLETPMFKIYHADRDTNNKVDCFIRKIRLKCFGVRSFTVSGYPLKFQVSGDVKSVETDLGFVPVIDGSYTVRHGYKQEKGNPVPGTGIIVSQDAGYSGTSINRYTLTLTGSTSGQYGGVNYCDATPFVRSVSVSYPEVLNNPYGNGVELSPVLIDVGHTFSWDTLEVTWDGKLIFNNFSFMNKLMPLAQPIFWGEWLNATGAIAITIDARADVYDDHGNLIYSWDWTRLFTGYGSLQDTVSIGVPGQFVMSLHGREVTHGCPRERAPWQDGWNIYYAAAWWVNVAGTKVGTVGDTDLNFRQYVPSDPYGDAGAPASDGGKAYFLGQGTGGSPIWRTPLGIDPRSALSRIATGAGGVGFERYYDAYGKYSFQKFTLERTEQVERVFDMSFQLFGEGSDPNPLACVLKGGQVSKDLLEVRNKVSIVGLDPMQPGVNAIVEHRADTDSLYNTGGGTALSQTKHNFLGFPMALVNANSMFASRQYAEDAADLSFDILSQPGLQGSITCLPQPDMFAKRRIGIKDRRSGLYGETLGGYMELVVMGVRHTISKGSFYTSIDFRALPQGQGGQLPIF